MKIKAFIKKLLDENTKYGDIFPNDAKKIPLSYKDWCKKIHPDVCADPQATDAFMPCILIGSSYEAIDLIFTGL